MLWASLGDFVDMTESEAKHEAYLSVIRMLDSIFSKVEPVMRTSVLLTMIKASVYGLAESDGIHQNQNQNQNQSR